MSKTKLNYRFHNPNSDKVTAEVILQVCIDANRAKVERAIAASLAESAADDGDT